MVAAHEGCTLGENCGGAECSPRRAMLKRSVEGARDAWGALEIRKDPRSSAAGGPRHYLDGKPVHCGDVLELQERGRCEDDYGDYFVPVLRGARVRYEASGFAEGSIHATLHANVAGEQFVADFQPHMRFRWPERR
jgi:hypothetical protein